jgi:hypothetical protein
MFMDRLQKQNDGALRHLVFERGNAEPTKTAVRLGDEMPTDWLCAEPA